jgi:hypothetical protein
MTDRAGNPPDIDQHYFSYMMRLLRTQSGEGQAWRVSLEEPLTQEVYRFEDLQTLFAFLVARTEQQGLREEATAPSTKLA